MKTVPTVRLADAADAVGLRDLPEEVRLAMADIAGGARGAAGDECGRRAGGDGRDV
jgi:acyl-CoA synthetase (NDP forming)